VLLWHVDRLAQVSPMCTLPGTALGCRSIRAFMQGRACISSTCSLQAVSAKKKKGLHGAHTPAT
jgi:hypothetical protein